MPQTTPSSALPAHLQISETIARAIASGQLMDGAKLMPERALADQYDVAVGTLRKALAALEQQGLIERVQGSGNYVRHTPDVRTIYALFRLERLDGGGLPTAELLSVNLRAKPSDAPAFGPSTQAHRFRRLRFLDGAPVALEEIWLDAARAPTIDQAAVSDSLYFFYENHLNLRISHCTDRLSVAPAPDWTEPRFRPAPGTRIGYIERVTFDTTQTPFEFSRTWYDPDCAVYVSRLK